MSINVKLTGVEKVVAALRAKAAKHLQDSNVAGVVGFSQEYAIYVHENMEAKHPVGQAKYLEQPLRMYAGQMAEIIRKAVKDDGKTVAQGILLACLFLQREAQKLVPVDTGALKNSAFTRIEKT